MKLDQLTAPFPYFGGRSRVAKKILKRLGDVTVYVEPFAGSLAVLLAGAPHKREIVCDINGFVVNFWRALQHDPDTVAHYADYPTYHDDLTARHRWLVQWARDKGTSLSDDPDWYDPQAAGWWAWGASNWIGGGWCVGASGDKRPHVGSHTGGQGLQVQRHDLKGVGIGSGDRLRSYFYTLAQRLSGVVVLNRSWESALTPSLLMHTRTEPKPPVGILMDPPYLVDERSADLYTSDQIGTSNNSAEESYRWARKWGARYRIAYCCRDGDFPVPAGWTAETHTFGGVKRKARRDMVMFSPACVELPGSQQSSFEFGWDASESNL